jgi:threonine synthase
MTMRYVSTRGLAPAVGFREALMAGLAPDGGLYVPERLPVLPPERWAELRAAPLSRAATMLLAPMLSGEMQPEELERLLADALDFPIPLVHLGSGLSVLELFHGPTFAFKDVGARVLARLVSAFHDDGHVPVTVLVATSGDTGGAVAQAFHRVPRTRVIVLYPEGQVSDVQEAQFAALGDNVMALAVAGTFDDCQRMVKAAFADAGLTARLRLTSANSISIGRLLPQTVYYAHAIGQLPAGARPVVSVPSGNFGNLAAGLIAWRMGAPIARFVASTTVNDTVPRYLSTGRVEPRPSVRTLANAMDVGDPSNLERIRWMFGDRVDAIRQTVGAHAFTDLDVRTAVRELDTRYGYVADPHTAIAWLGARTAGATEVVFLATAHPAKFGDIVGGMLGRPVVVPPALAAALSRPKLAIGIPATLDALVPFLAG